MKNKIIIVLTGEICAGKSTLAKGLEDRFGFDILRTRDAIKHYAKKDFKVKRNEDERRFLQRVGESLDNRTGGDWIISYFQSEINKSDRIVVDSIRIAAQIDSFRNSYGHQNVFQVHLFAPDKILERRYFDRENWQYHDLTAINDYTQYKQNATEIGVKKLIDDADLVIDTEHLSPEDNLIRAGCFFRMLPSLHDPLVDVVVGGQFGSEGKGQIAAFLSPEYDCLVRVGGPNAGHKVYEDPSPDTFHILPSGSKRAHTSKIIIGPGAVISVDVILKEILDFGIATDRLLIDENATIIAKKDITLEKKIDKIGSTQQGVGAATANNLLFNRLNRTVKHKAKFCKELKQYIGNAHCEFENLFSSQKKILLEGTQGTMLSLHHGIYPYVTSRDTTVGGCISEAGISPKRIRKIILVTRRYPIRVQNPPNGTSGPFSRNIKYKNEIDLDEIAIRSKIPLEEIKKIEITSTTHRPRRIGEFNWALFRESCELNSPTDIALTFTDYIDIANRKARRFDQLTKETTKFIDEIERCATVSVSLIATHFNHRSVIDRRNWI